MMAKAAPAFILPLSPPKPPYIYKEAKRGQAAISLALRVLPKAFFLPLRSGAPRPEHEPPCVSATPHGQPAELCGATKRSIRYPNHMFDEKAEFMDALAAYVGDMLERDGLADEPGTAALRIVDARNHLFAPAGRHTTDEEEGIYALRDLCRLDEDTLRHVPNRRKLAALAHDIFG